MPEFSMMPDARPDARPGTYALVLQTTVTAGVAIGRRHVLPLSRAFGAEEQRNGKPW